MYVSYSSPLIWQLTYPQDSLHIYKSGLVIWPLVSLIGFALLPVQHRVLFGCVIGIAWGVYLNLVAMHE